MLDNIFKSLTIAERYSLLAPLDLKEDPQSMDHWRSDMSIISNKTFDQMLYINNYNKETFSHAVQYNPDPNYISLYNDKAMQAQWFNVFQEALDLVEDTQSSFSPKNDLNDCLHPFMRYAYTKIQHFLQQHDHIILNKEVVEQLLSQLTKSLMDMAHKALVLELNLCRENDQLEGDTPEERFLSFISKFNSKHFLTEFFNKYIVLTRLLSTTTLFFITNIQQMLIRIFADEQELRNQFGIHNFTIDSIKLGEGDTHQQGNTVSIITFSGDKNIVYKPKRLQINLAFNKLIDWLNTQAILELRGVHTAVHDDYAYEEHIAYKPCSSLDEVESYYKRFGQLMAVIQLLNGTDIHMENLISHGQYPVIIDLETLIQQPMPLGKQESQSLKPLTDTLFHHVTRTLFLPTNGVKIEDPLKIDLSALNGRQKKFEFKVLQPVNQGTDQLKYDYQDFELEGANNLPFIKNNDLIIDYKMYRDQIIEGYRDVCTVFLKNKESLLQEGSVLYHFRGVHTRCLFRDTSQYANIMMHLHHPEMLMDMLDREKAIENMWSFPYTDRKLNQAESLDMMVEDIPIFFSVSDKPNILTSTNEVITDFYTINSFDYFIQTIRNLTEHEINKQISIIHLHYGDFSEYRIQTNKALQYSNSAIKDLSRHRIDFIKEAENIAERIMQTAFTENTLSWIIPYESERDVWSLIPIREDFYNGVGGIYLMFHFLYQKTRNEKYAFFINQILEHYPVDQATQFELGLSGYPGLFYAFSLIEDYGANKLKITKMINQYCEQFEKLPESHIESKLQFDYLNGYTSLIHALLRFYKRRKDQKFIQLAIKLSNLLINKLENIESINSGFGHGISSYALTLFKMGEITKLPQYTNKAIALIKDANQRIDETHQAMSWCHGYIGEGIARIVMEPWLHNLDDTIIQASILNKAKNDQLLFNDCMCHGNMGITELFLTHYIVTKDKDSFELARNIASEVIHLKQANGQYKLMDINEYPDVSLFTGLAGIAYQLLRINDPEGIPSILTI